MNLPLRCVGEILLSVTLYPGSPSRWQVTRNKTLRVVVTELSSLLILSDIICKVGANAIRLHDEVVFTLANLFRSIGIDPVVEPVRLFDADPDLDDRRRPDILIRNPRGFDRQVILDVSVTGADLFDSCL